MDEQSMFHLYICGIYSISGMSDPARKCPPYWKADMHALERLLWLKALFDHLEKCYRNGTYGLPQVPSTDVKMITPVIDLKHVLNVVKHIVERKVRVCANGSKKIQGIDYQESFASALLGLTFNLSIVICCWFVMLVYHLDISNCFQCTTDESTEHLWMGSLLPEWIQMLK